MTILFLALLPLAVGRDVVVVGGGMAGIAAARKLQQNGHKVTLLEARDRMGGRVWTSTSLGFPTDLGASWIHGANAQNPLTPFVSEFSIYTEDHPDEQNCRYDKDGNQYSSGDLTSFQSYCYDFDGSGTGTMENALRNYDPAFFNTVEGEMCLAVRDFNQGSALDLVSVANERQSEVRDPSGPELVFRDGYNTLTGNLTAQFLAAGGTGVTNAVVTEVKYCEGFSEGGAIPECQAQVTTTSGSYTADAVIVAVPLGVLQAGSVTFSPALPAKYTAAIDRMQFGVVNKAVAVFPNDFWSAGCGNELMVAINQRGANIDNRGMFPYFMNTNKVWPGTNALMGFAVGRYAIASESKTDAEVQADFMSRLRQQYPNAPEPTSFIRSKWQSDPYAKGSYTTPSGINAQSNELRTLSEAVSASLSLAGEHTNPTWAATVHGAFLSGERAADDIMNGMPTASATASRTALSMLLFLSFSMF